MSDIPNISVIYTCLTCYCCIMTSSDKTKCPKCSSEVKDGDSICCSICNVWHHLQCLGLSREQFLQYTRNKTTYLLILWMKKSLKNYLIYLLKNWKKQYRGSHGVKFATKRTFIYQL